MPGLRQTYEAVFEKQKYCSTECGLLRMRLHMGKCAMCGSEFRLKGNERFCSEDCKSEYYKTHEIGGLRFEERIFICRNCGRTVGGEIVPKNKEFCSYECQKRYYSRIGKMKRREQMNRLFVEGVSFEEIYERDKGICQICGRPVDINLQYIDKYSPTIDHKVPLSKGGLHEKTNCQLAHRYCNSLKGDNEDYEYDDREVTVWRTATGVRARALGGSAKRLPRKYWPAIAAIVRSQNSKTPTRKI